MIKHTSYDLDLSFGFGGGSTCSERSISDVSVYVMRCQKGCTACKNNTSTCLACEANYFFNNATKKCIPTMFCHSTCDSCSVDSSSSKCTACSSSIASLNYVAFLPGKTEGSCSMQATNNAQLLMTINKNSVLGTTTLKSVLYNSLSESTSGLVLSSFLYSQNVIDFKSLTSNTITFGFDSLGVHQKLHVRARVFTECSSENKTISMTLSGRTSTVQTMELQSMISSII